MKYQSYHPRTQGNALTISISVSLNSLAVSQRRVGTIDRLGFDPRGSTVFVQTNRGFRSKSRVPTNILILCTPTLLLRRQRCLG